MQHRQIHCDDHGARTFAVILDSGDEAVTSLTAFAKSERLSAASLTAIGAFRRAVLGYFEWNRKDYLRNAVDDQVEVVSLIGDIALDDGEPSLHLHAVLGARDGHALGGHLLEGEVRPTLEVVVAESPAHLHRRHDPTTGLALLRLASKEAS